MSSQSNSDRQSLIRAGRLHWFHWAIVAFSLILTSGAFLVTRGQVEAGVEARFEREAQRVVDLVQEHMRIYEYALLGGVAAHEASSGVMGFDEWRNYADSLGIEARYPGINGIGVVNHVSKDGLDDYLATQRLERPGFRVFPDHDQPEYFPITYSEPSSLNAKAIGLDMAHETNRYEGAKLARESGNPTITGPIVLVQDSEKTPGFLFYAPFYDDTFDGTFEARKESFIGLVYAPFIMTNLMAGTLEKERRKVGIRISDGLDILYDEHSYSEADFDAKPLFTSTHEIEFYGRKWSFDTRSALSFRKDAKNAQPWIILAGGIIIDILLLGSFLFLSKANRRAVTYAEEMTSELRERTDQLESSNLELERFAYVASHDMRTPLRGVGSLVEYLSEDLEEYIESEEANPDVQYNLGRISEQVGRMDSLIRGVLEFASLDHAERGSEKVVMADLLANVIADAGLKPRQVTVTSDFESFETDRVQLIQVLGNLVGNANKYHHNHKNLHLRLEAKAQGEWIEFTVADNGPGIDKRFHERIFEAFRTLQPKDEIESTGIGLAIVKKVVERYSGQISVESAEGQGAIFTFTWPRSLEATTHAQV